MATGHGYKIRKFDEERDVGTCFTTKTYQTEKVSILTSLWVLVVKKTKEEILCGSRHDLRFVFSIEVWDRLLRDLFAGSSYRVRSTCIYPGTDAWTRL